MKNLNSKELRNYRVSVDEIEIIKDKSGTPEKVECWCYIQGHSEVLNGEYESKFIDYDKYSEFVKQEYDYNSLEEYIEKATLLEKLVDTAFLINKEENRTEEYPDEERRAMVMPDLASDIQNMLLSGVSSYKRIHGIT